MIDLLLAIVFFNVILVFFKLFDRFNVNNLQAIVVNYLVAGTCGILFTEQKLAVGTILHADWLFLAVLIGLIFIIVFNLLASGAQKVGLTIATVANKMSVILPVTASFFLYGDRISFLKIAGILLALVGVILSSTSGKKLNFDRKYLWLILIIFFGQGIADTLFNYAQKIYVDESFAELFIAILFLSAFFSGSLIALAKGIKEKTPLKLKNIGWGIAVGIPNYLTLFYFFRALESGIFESSQVYPIINMGVIILSAFSGLLLFKEKLNLVNWLGIMFSILAIAALTFG